MLNQQARDERQQEGEILLCVFIFLLDRDECVVGRLASDPGFRG